MLKNVISMVHILLFMLLSCSSNEPRQKSLIIENSNHYVTITGTILDAELKSPMVGYFDPVELKIKPIILSQYSVNNKKFILKFRCDKPKNILLFLKDVWVQPGDSINVEYTVLNENPFKDTLIFKGNNIGGYLIYPLITPILVHEKTGYPFYTDSKFKKNEEYYKKQLNSFFLNLNLNINTVLEKYNTSTLLKEKINHEVKYWLLGDYIMYCTENQISVNKNIKDSFHYNNLESRRYNIALKAIHENLSQQDYPNKSSLQYYNELFNTANKFSFAEKDFLYFQTIQHLSKTNIQGNSDKLSIINDSIYNKIGDTSLKRRIAELLGRNSDVNTSEIHLKDMNNNVFLFNDVIKKSVGKSCYIDFWASWCIPCRKEFPNSIKLIGNYPNIEFIYISIDENEKQWVETIRKENLPIQNCYLMSKGDFEKVQNVFGFTAIPHYIFYNKKGELIIRDAPRPSDSDINLLLESK